jgi:hypothetical protein
MTQVKIREKMFEELSNCCGAEMTVCGSKGWSQGTHYWECTECGKPCDPLFPKTKNK